MNLPDLRSHQKAASAKLGKEFNTWADRVHAALQRTRDVALTNAAAQEADGVPYDNGASGLSATNVQDAIDELAATVGGGGLSAGTPPTIVQYKSSLTSKSVTLDSAPINGNLLVAICKAGDPSADAGWTVQDSNTGGSNYNFVLTKVAGVAESATQTALAFNHNADAICMWELNGQSAAPVVFANATIQSAASLFFTCGPAGPIADGAPTSLPGMSNVLALGAIFNDTTTPQTLTAAMNMTQSELSNSGTYTHFVSGHSDGATPEAQLISRCTTTTVATRAGIIHITS